MRENQRSAGRHRPVYAVAGAGAAALCLSSVLAACGGSSGGGGSAGASAGASGNPRAIGVTVTAAGGCGLSTATAPAGALTFNITNKDATAVSEIELLGGERIVGEKENLPPGFSGTFAVNVDGGKYTLYCPGAKQEKIDFTVTGTAAAGTGDTSVDGLLATGVKQYSDYVTTQVGYLVTSSEALATALKGTDLAAAQQAYMKARPYYEKIEPVAESFTADGTDLDAAIDARVDDVPLDQLTGFHKIENGLFEAKSLDGLSTIGDGLVTNVKKLQTLTTGLTYKPFELANGSQELLDEVSSSKITGEEERYSHIDLLDFQGNDEGAEQAFADLQPALTKIDATLTGKVSTAFTALNTLVDKYRTGDNPSGFVLYTSLTDSDKRDLAAAVKAVQEPLSQVASKVTGG
jgi:iron uptake system component EfeO